jgi:hypothetical protein
MFAKNKCHTCYSREAARARRGPPQPRRIRPVTCPHPDQRHYAQGLCRRCYVRQQASAKYGQTLAEYERLAAAQGNVCALCGRTQRPVPGVNRVTLSVDHDHRTGRVRGLLCNDCNRGLGLLGDDPVSLRRALAYVGGDL